MAIIRTKHDDKRYVNLNKKSLQDPNLSWSARGLWAYLLSLPDNWEVSVAHLSNFYKGTKKRGSGEKTIYALIAELTENGYITSQSKKDNGGRFAGNDYTVFESQQTANQLEKIPSTPNPNKLKKIVPNPVKRDAVKRDAVILPLTINNDKEYINRKNDINVSDDRSLSIDESIVPFDPDTFILPNGKPLSLQMRRAIKKYSETDKQKLHANVCYFLKKAKQGTRMDNPEAYLQNCINMNYAQQETNSWQNKIYAEWKKEEFKLHGLKILKSVVQFKRSTNEAEESLSFSLPTETFSEILDKYAAREINKS